VGTVYVSFWFDVEDYVTPESDDALHSLLRIFNERGAPATWKLVAEKLRVLKQRRRDDVVGALHQQSIGYHTDNHSQHPTVSEYLTGMGWQAGVAEFRAREGDGFEELRREFGPVCCYGQPGGAWSPHVFPVLREWDVPMYLDEGRHIGLNSQPFWYQDVLTVFNLRENCIRLDIGKADKEAALTQAKEQFERTVERLMPTGGLISIYYHPCEFATREFWDGVNFGKGRNTPRDQWRPARLLPAYEAEARLKAFAAYVDYALSCAGAQVIGGDELASLYGRSEAKDPLPVLELLALVERMGEQITYADSTVGFLSPAQLFSGLVEALAQWQECGRIDESVPIASLLGPAKREGREMSGSASVASIVAGAQRCRAETRETGHLPSHMEVDSQRLGTATAFRAMASALRAILRDELQRDEAVQYARGRLALEAQVARSGTSWGWTIFPEGFSAPDLLELSRLQAWTMKPAVLRR